MYLKCLLVQAVLSLGCVLGYVANSPTIYLEKSQLSLQVPNIDKEFQPTGEQLAIHDIEEVLNIKFSIENSEPMPQQVSLLLGYPELSLEIGFLPEIKRDEDATTYHFKIRFSSLPQPLLKIANSRDTTVSASLIVAGEDTQDRNIFVRLVELSLRGLPLGDWVEPARLGPQEPIKHIFTSLPKTVSKYYAITFCLLVGFCSVSLLALWVANFSKNISLPRGMSLLSFLFFIVRIAAIEAIFTKYYLGSSIFRTLYLVGLMAIVSLISDYRTLENVLERRFTKSLKQQ